MRNAGKPLLILCSLAGFCGFIALVVHVYQVFKGPAFEQSVAMVREHEQVLEQFGSPIDVSALVTGNYFVYGAMIQYEIEGPLASGTVYAMASKDADGWVVDSVFVQPEGSDDYIAVSTYEPTEFSSAGSCEPPDEDYKLDLPPEPTTDTATNEL